MSSAKNQFEVGQLNVPEGGQKATACMKRKCKHLASWGRRGCRKKKKTTSDHGLSKGEKYREEGNSFARWERHSLSLLHRGERCHCGWRKAGSPGKKKGTKETLSYKLKGGHDHSRQRRRAFVPETSW